ncbi:arylsulfatase [Mariniblastus sp.]|nr:arylsulfatase [bacterium]MDA7903158.1 arylsulfatase [Mariniblastus sp.]MDB4564690.1 arylsulfatase [Mariniblastus sp.]
MWILYSTRCVLLVLAALMMTHVAEATEKRPNIIYILADDLGYGDLGCYGQEKIKTPNIDRLARTGMRFTDHYSGAPVCAPARCVLLTGLHTGHCPIRGNRALEFEGNVPIPKSYVTLGEVMQKAGYATGAFGKWGQGYPGSVGDPVLRGFDQFYGYNCQREAHNYYPGHLWKNDKKVVLTGNAKGQKEQYSHDLITEQALSFIATPRDKPFFVYVPYTIPHTSFQVPDLESYQATTWSANQKTQAAMISRMDRDVGRIIKEVQALGELENTLIIFSSDNGPHGAGKTLAHFNAAGPLRGKKGATYEGGIRVPLVVSWPGKIKSGSESDHISGFQDLLPTFAELAGAKVPANIDGISFVSELLGRPSQKEHEYLYWELGTRQGLRKGNWKVVRNSTKKKLGKVEIYNLTNDIGEGTDLATQRPELAADFLELLQSARKPSELFPIPVLDNEK